MGSFNSERNNRLRSLSNITVDNLKLPLEEALNVDLKEVVIPGVYPDKLSGNFNKNYLVQIKKIVEIGPNKVLNGGGGYQHSLLLTLSDGYVSHKALEVGEIPGLNINTRPGTKLVLFGPKLKIVGQCFMYLDSSMAQVVGGSIKELNAKWEMTKSLENHRRDNTSREGGPPAWAPFGKKINKDVLKNVPNSVRKEEKKSTWFDSQRDEAINAARSSTVKKNGGSTSGSKVEKTGKNNKNYNERQSKAKLDHLDSVTNTKPVEKSIPKESTNAASTNSSKKDPPIVEQPSETKKEPSKTFPSRSSSVTKTSFYDQFQKPPPSNPGKNYNSDNQQVKSRNYPDRNYSCNQLDVAAPTHPATDYNSFQAPSQPYPNNSYTSKPPTQTYGQNDYFIQNQIPSTVTPAVRSDYDFKNIPMPNQSHLQYSNNTYPLPVNQVQNYNANNYFNPVQPPFSSFNKNDYNESHYMPPQTLVFTSSNYSNRQPANHAPGFSSNNYEPSKHFNTRNQYNRPSGTYDSKSYNKNSYTENATHDWIQPVENDYSQTVPSYQHAKNNSNAVPRHSPNNLTDFENQVEVYSKNNYSQDSSNLLYQNDYGPQYQPNVGNSFKNSSQQSVQRYNQNHYDSQNYFYNNKSNFSGSQFVKTKPDESFNHKFQQRPMVRPPNKINDRGRPNNFRGGRGRGFNYYNQQRYNSNSSKPPPALHDYLDNKLNINSG